jgi:hypothetical protein
LSIKNSNSSISPAAWWEHQIWSALMSDLQSGRKHKAKFLRVVAHAFGGVRDSEVEDEDMAENEAETHQEAEDEPVSLDEEVRANEDVVNSLPMAIDVDSASQPRITKRRRIAVTTCSPAQRKRLRDLPVRRAKAFTTSLATQA